MGKKVLVAYASKYGSTAGVAEAIAEVLCAKGAEVDVKAVDDVKRIEGYDAVIVGSCIRMGRPIGPATRFASKHRKALASVKTAVFSVGLAMKEDTPESRVEAGKFILPLVEKMPTAVSTGLFGGMVVIETLPKFLQRIAASEEPGTFDEGDWRDFDAIRSWASDIAPLLGVA